MFKNIHEAVEITENTEKIILTQENVAEVWNLFLSENKDTLQNIFMLVAQSQVPVLIEDKITFVVSNTSTYEMMQLHGTDITIFFRERTNMPTVSPQFILEKSEQTTKSYKSNKDRLAEIIQKNNAVLKLIEKFDLSME